jgi:aminoglycoside phosphotransferase (APT) family kinase protein
MRGGSSPQARPDQGRLFSTAISGRGNLLRGDDGDIAGVLDWELTGPAGPLYDTGHLAWFTIPLMDDTRAKARRFPRPPRREARLHAFARGTGLSPSQVLRAALEAQQEYARRVITGPTEPWATFRRLGFHENAAADGRWTRTHFPDDAAR